MSSRPLFVCADGSMRIPLLVFLIAALASPAAAQIYRDLHLENRLALQHETARQRALAADRELMVLESRARTAASLQSLESARLTTSLPEQSLASAPLDPQLAADIEAVANAQAKAFEESNARMRAITQEGGR